MKTADAGCPEKSRWAFQPTLTPTPTITVTHTITIKITVIRTENPATLTNTPKATSIGGPSR
ncbi:MAG: hypothetical protein ABSA69_10370 [Verrucomicrobiota bacterium]